MFTASVREPMIGVGWNWSAAHYSDALPLYQLDDPGSGGKIRLNVRNAAARFLARTDAASRAGKSDPSKKFGGIFTARSLKSRPLAYGHSYVNNRGASKEDVPLSTPIIVNTPPPGGPPSGATPSFNAGDTAALQRPAPRLYKAPPSVHPKRGG